MSDMIQDRLSKTGELYTQDVIKILLFHEIARVQRYSVPLTVMRLKAEFPQSTKLQVGEAVKKIVTHVLKANLRLVDMSGRFQNDFLTILPVTDDAGAKKVARRLVSVLYNVHPYRYGRTLEITPYIGLATLPAKTTLTVEAFVAQATKALTEAYRRAPGSILSYADLTRGTQPLTLDISTPL